MQDERNTVIAQIAAQARPGQKQVVSEQLKTQMKTLAELEAELVQKSMVYSDEYPVIKELKRKIAALKKLIASAPPPAVSVTDAVNDEDVATKVLEQQEMNLQRDLDEANRKLAAARLGESMEKNQQAEHLQLISSPELPHQPVGPKKLKIFALAIAFAGMIGGGAAFAAEMLDRSIHSSQDLARIIDPRLIVTIPYVFVPGEESRRRLKIILLSVALFAAIMAALIAFVVSKGASVDLDSVWLSISSHFAH